MWYINHTITDNDTIPKAYAKNIATGWNKNINVMTIATNIHINAEIVIALFLLFI